MRFNHMKSILITIGLAGALVLPAGATAKPNETNKSAAKRQCQAERGQSHATLEAFKAKYHSFNRCARHNAAEEETESEAAHKNAAKQCKAERSDPSFAATHENKSFEQFYGTNKNGKNAYGKCVSKKAKEQKAEMDTKDQQETHEFKNAAKECASERAEIGLEAFAAKYGTNHNKRNAFGKCVTRKTKESGP
jgi:hypothetical protein